MKTVLVSGQSNTMGRGTGGPSLSDVDSRVRVWNNINPLGANGSAFVSASAARTAGTFENTDTNNFGVWFAHRLAQVRDDDVRMTMVARGATTIESWAPGAAIPMLAEMISVWAATGQGPADVFLWHQGEGNVSTAYATYKAAFLALLANLTSAGIINANTTVIVGGLSEDNPDRVNFNVGALQTLATENAQIFYANSTGLSSYDGTHFNGQSLYTMGVERYFAAYAEAKGIVMADLFALVNEGGTPGEAGTGENKLYNLLNLALLGMGKKNTTTSAAFTGTPPVDKLLTAGMLAAGSIVDFGTDATNGSWVRFESGLQICWAAKTLTYSGTSLLSVLWTFAKPFVTGQVMVSWSPNLSIASTGFSVGAKRGGSLATTNSFETGVGGNLRMESNALYVSGDTCGATAIAIGFWKV